MVIREKLSKRSPVVTPDHSGYKKIFLLRIGVQKNSMCTKNEGRLHRFEDRYCTTKVLVSYLCAQNRKPTGGTYQDQREREGKNTPNRLDRLVVTHSSSFLVCQREVEYGLRNHTLGRTDSLTECFRCRDRFLEGNNVPIDLKGL